MTTTELGKHLTLGANRLNLVLVILVVLLHGKDALSSLVLPHNNGTKPSLTQWGNIVHLVVTFLVVEVISPYRKIVLGTQG